MTKTIAALAVLSLGALSCGNLIEAKKAWAPQNDFAVEPVQEFPLETAELSSNSIVVWKRGVTVEDQNAFGALTQRLGQAKAAIGKLMAENPGVPGFIQLATRKGALEADVRARTGEIATLTTERATASSPRQAEIDARLVTLNQEKTAKEAELNGVLAQLAPLAPTLGPVVADLQAKKARPSIRPSLSWGWGSLAPKPTISRARIPRFSKSPTSATEAGCASPCSLPMVADSFSTWLAPAIRAYLTNVFRTVRSPFTGRSSSSRTTARSGTGKPALKPSYPPSPLHP